ncbi:hypothetical protein OQA88_2627 [Cercophora sp. LCS_1]
MQIPLTAELRPPSELVTFLLKGDPKHDLGSVTHRQNLVKAWSIPPGATILEIGCGQGDFTVPAADAVGPTGHITAVDPADPALGAPPIGAAQAHVKASPVGHQITFVHADGLGHLRDPTTGPWDYVVLSHSVWYLPDATIVQDIMSAARTKTKNLLIAEFSLASSRAEGKPAVLAALTANALESFLDGSSLQAVHNAVSPRRMVELAREVGWRVGEERTLRTPDGERYAWRETAQILKTPIWEDRVRGLEQSDKVKEMLFGMRDALRAAVEGLEGGMNDVVNMDVWAVRFEAD